MGASTETTSIWVAYSPFSSSDRGAAARTYRQVYDESSSSFSITIESDGMVRLSIFSHQLAKNGAISNVAEAAGITVSSQTFYKALQGFFDLTRQQQAAKVAIDADRLWDYISGHWKPPTLKKV